MSVDLLLYIQVLQQVIHTKAQTSVLWLQIIRHQKWILQHAMTAIFEHLKPVHFLCPYRTGCTIYQNLYAFVTSLDSLELRKHADFSEGFSHLHIYAAAAL